MLGLLLVALGSVSAEAGTSIGKYEVEKKKAGIYTMGFLNLFWSGLFLIALSFFLSDGWRFSVASLPTLSLRVVLEILQVYFTLKAIATADRSTFGFLRILTIPLLLGVDIFLGYDIGLLQIVGIGFIVVSLLFLFLNHGLSRKGSLFVLLSALNAVVTISLYKYDIANFNSVAAEQIAVGLVVFVFLLYKTLLVERVNPFRLLMKKAFLVESLSMGLGAVLISFAYLFGAASIITTGSRAFGILTSMVSGRAVFHEKHVMVKLVAFVMIIIGLFLLA